MGVDLQRAQQALPEWFAGKLFNASHVTVSELSAPGAGASNETYFVTVSYECGGNYLSDDFVIRWPPSGFLVFPEHAYDMPRQYELLKVLQGTDIPTPPVFGLETDPSILGAPFFVMKKISGWIPGDFPPYHQAGRLFEASPDKQAEAWWAGLEAMHGIHRLDWEAAGLSILGAPSETGFMDHQIKLYDDVLAQNIGPVPYELRSTRQWLLDNRFVPEKQVLCWGDARLGNMIFRDVDIAAILDWEMAVIGDPIADLAWFLHVDWAASEGRPSAPTPRLPGLPGKADTIAHYEKISGRKVKNFDYYDVLATYRLAIVYTRIEQNESYLQKSGNKRGMLTTTHFEKLQQIVEF